MERKMFGHRMKKKSSHMDENQMRHSHHEMNEDDPPGYEGKEHVHYEDPGYSEHEIRYPEDEPHMKSHVSRNEEHEAEDDYHMDVPNQTHDSLESQVKRARMNMDAPNQQDPKPLRGNMVHNVPYKGTEDTSGEEEEGPNHMQGSGHNKERRKKMIVAVMKGKMKKNRPHQEKPY